MRVHPLTRLVKDPESGEFQVETRIEFTDRDAATSRCAGVMKIALLGRTAESEEPIQEEWRIELDDPEINAVHFDEVTRTYLFKLALDSDVPLNQGSLTARFESADGNRFSARYELVTD